MSESEKECKWSAPATSRNMRAFKLRFAREKYQSAAFGLEANVNIVLGSAEPHYFLNISSVLHLSNLPDGGPALFRLSLTFRGACYHKV